MPDFEPPKKLEGPELSHDGGFTIWGLDCKFRKLPERDLPARFARLGYVNRSAVLDGERAIHAEYDFPDSNIIMVTYWTHGGTRIL